MNPRDFNDFAGILGETFSYYGAELTDTMANLYFEGLQDYELGVIHQALLHHMKHPEKGDWKPKINNIIAFCEGGSLDNAFIAWQKVEDAMRLVGGYSEVVFDDELIHHIIPKIGGWPKLCDATMTDLKFIKNDFNNLYKSLYKKNEYVDAIVPRLFGISATEGHVDPRHQKIALIGDQVEAQKLLERTVGEDVKLLTIYDPRKPKLKPKPRLSSQPLIKDLSRMSPEDRKKVERNQEEIKKNIKKLTLSVSLS